MDILEIKDFIIDMGILGDIAKRDLSGKTRKEDDINLLDKDGFKKYFESHYECVFKYGPREILSLGSGNSGFQYLQIPILNNDIYIYSMLYEFKNSEPDKIILKMPESVYNSLYKEYPNFFKKYKIRPTIPTGGYKVIPPDTLTNEFTLKFIDDIIKIGEEQIWRKK